MSSAPTVSPGVALRVRHVSPGADEMVLGEKMFEIFVRSSNVSRLSLLSAGPIDSITTKITKDTNSYRKKELQNDEVPAWGSSCPSWYDFSIHRGRKYFTQLSTIIARFSLSGTPAKSSGDLCQFGNSLAAWAESVPHMILS